MNKGQIQSIVREKWTKWSQNIPVMQDLLQSAKVGSPACIYTVEGEPSYWLVPLVTDGKACGFASLDLNGKFIRNGIFGASSDDKNSWIELSYFKEPPKFQLAELHNKYSGCKLSKPLFSFDRHPSRFAWLIMVEERNKIINYIFITPDSWYIKKSFVNSKNRE